MPATGGGVAGVEEVDGGVTGEPVPIGGGVAASPPPPPPQATFSIKTNAPKIHTFPFRRFFNHKSFICSDILTSPVALIFADHLIIVCEGIYNFFDITIIAIKNSYATKILPFSIVFKCPLEISFRFHLY